MNNGNTFSYTYSAPENREVLSIRKKYLSLEESQPLRISGITQSLCSGIGGALLFGLGMVLAAEVTGHLVWLGLLLGLMGAAGMVLAYPVYLKS